MASKLAFLSDLKPAEHCMMGQIDLEDVVQHTRLADCRILAGEVDR